MNDTLLIPSRYCGPARSGNGGYVAGSLAEQLINRLGGVGPRAVRVMLRQPPPLESTMTLVDSETGLDLIFAGALVAQAEVVETSVEPVEGVSFEEAVTASASYPGHRTHPFPTCFACGTERPDGLRIFPGQVAPAHESRTRVAAPWIPDLSIQSEDKAAARGDEEPGGDQIPRASLAATWSALDCVGGWAGDLTDRPMVLGSITAVVDALPLVGEQHVVTGEHRGSQGRKTFTATTLHDGDGRIVGRAEHVWLAIDPAAYNN